MKPNPDLINMALEYLESDLSQNVSDRQFFNNQNKIPNKIKGYISSFGGSIVQVGIMPSCMAFLANDEKSLIVKSLHELYKIKYDPTLARDIKEFLSDNWAHWNTSQKKQYRHRLASIAVSFKLALRTFEMDEND